MNLPHRLAHKPDAADLRSDNNVTTETSSISTSTISSAPSTTLLNGNAQRQQGVQDSTCQSSSPINTTSEHHLLTARDTWPHSGRDFKAGRRLIVGCDGTWLNSDSQNGLPSNVTRLCRALNVPDSAAPQLVYYHRGMGTDGGDEAVAAGDKYLNGTTGATIEEHVRESYSFLVNNYHGPSDAAPGGDEIFLFGFSRGAYTVRVLATLVADIGMLTRYGMEFFSEIFDDWKNMNVCGKSDAGPVKSGVFKGMAVRPKMPSEEYQKALYERGYANHYQLPVLVRAIGVFDTVGHLGIPLVMGLHFTAQEAIQFSFVNTKVAKCIQHAFQALALDEHRASYSPTLWELPDEPHNLQTLAQTWFPGVHCNVGGSGYIDETLSNATLAWMISKIAETEPSGPMLDFDTDYLKWVFKHDINISRDIKLAPGNDNDGTGPDAEPGFRGWAKGRMEETDVGIFSVTGERKPLGDIWEDKTWLQSIKDLVYVGDQARTPGRYPVVNADTGVVSFKQEALVGTGEKIHCSARVRIASGGRGLTDRLWYTPKGLENFELENEKGEDCGKMMGRDPSAKRFRWVGRKMGVNGGDVVLKEEELGGFERVLFELSVAEQSKK